MLEIEKIEIVDYYEKKQGKGRYILATYLRHLLYENHVHVDTVVNTYPMDTVGWDGAENIYDLVEIYIDHGFKQYDAEPGKPIILRSTVANILQTLQGPAKYMTYTESMLF